MKEWISLLAAERYNDAYEFLYHAGGEYWTPELIKTVIYNYGSIDPRSDNKTFIVTPLDTAIDGLTPRQAVTRYGENSGEVWFDLSLNGQWSDLTATFWFSKRNEELALQLNDIHVM